MQNVMCALNACCNVVALNANYGFNPLTDFRLEIIDKNFLTKNPECNLCSKIPAEMW